MKTRVETEFLVFTIESETGRTYQVDVSSKRGAYLGDIVFHAPWRRYVFKPDCGSITIMDAKCLIALATYLGELMADRQTNPLHGRPDGREP